MDYLLDTNAVSDLITENARVVGCLAKLDVYNRIITCTIVRGEVLFGLARLPSGKRRTELEEKASKVLTRIQCESVTPIVADAYASIKAARTKRGLPLDDNDCWIAATAISMGATPVSRDRDFQQIAGLRGLVAHAPN